MIFFQGFIFLIIIGLIATQIILPLFGFFDGKLIWMFRKDKT